MRRREPCPRFIVGLLVAVAAAAGAGGREAESDCAHAPLNARTRNIRTGRMPWTGTGFDFVIRLCLSLAFQGSTRSKFELRRTPWQPLRARPNSIPSASRTTLLGPVQIAGAKKPRGSRGGVSPYSWIL